MSRKVQERRRILMLRAESERLALHQHLLALEAPLRVADLGMNALRLVARHPVLAGISGFLALRVLPRAWGERAAMALGLWLRRRFMP